MRLENVYEQTFSNYYCYILDLSTSQQVTGLLATISHPVTDFKWFPHLNEVSALLYATQMVQTPYTMVLGPKLFPDVCDLEILANELIKADSELLSNYYTDDRLIGYRSKNADSTNPTIYNELFQTSCLNDLIKSSFVQKSDENEDTIHIF